MQNKLYGLALALALPWCAASASAASTDLVVSTASGPVRGEARTHYTQWLGIPYAAPPTGELRWKAPQPPRPWTQVRDGSKPGSACVQGSGWDPGYEKPTLNEDCLYLNVYRPADVPADAKLPVFLWIHGGGLRGGAGFDTDPRKFLNLGKVMFVTFNYRLSTLGFLALPGLTAEDRDATGSYGMLDQQAAIRWVHNNIAAFGGDPEQVSIAGQSAGGRSVCNQIVSPTNKGMFVRAFHQSGGCGSISIAEAEKQGARFAAELGCTDTAKAVACLRGKSAAEIFATYEKIRISTTVYGGRHFPMDPREAVRSGNFNRVPVVIGQTRDERTQSMFAARDYKGKPVTAAQFAEELQTRYGENAQKVAAEYPVGAYWSPTIALSTVEGDELSCQRRDLYGDFARHTPVYAYEFDERDAPAFVSISRLHVDFPFGATHVNELGYLFDYLREALPFSSAQGELSDQMIRYWVNFVRKGDPNGAGVTQWPRYSPSLDNQMSLKASGSAVKTSFGAEHKCGFWAALAK
jgi:para-nitrobenzyl esterase